MRNATAKKGLNLTAFKNHPVVTTPLGELNTHQESKSRAQKPISQTRSRELEGENDEGEIEGKASHPSQPTKKDTKGEERKKGTIKEERKKERERRVRGGRREGGAPLVVVAGEDEARSQRI